MKKLLLTGVAALLLATGTAHAGEGAPADEALIDTWKRTKILPTPYLPPVRPGLIWVWRPPPEYDKPFDGSVAIQEFRGEQMKGVCWGRVVACAKFIMGKPSICIVNLLIDFIKPPLNRKEMIRHEIGHCNGWPGTHPDSKWEWVDDPEEPPPSNEPEGPPIPMTIIKKAP